MNPSCFLYDFFRDFRLLWNRHDPTNASWCDIEALAGSDERRLRSYQVAMRCNVGLATEDRARSIWVFLKNLGPVSLYWGRLSERQQTVAWVVLTVLFFVLCNVLVRTNGETRAATGVRETLSRVDANQAGVYK